MMEGNRLPRGEDPRPRLTDVCAAQDKITVLYEIKKVLIEEPSGTTIVDPQVKSVGRPRLELNDFCDTYAEVELDTRAL